MSDQSAGHLDLDALADHLAGELDAGGHLASCAGCAVRLAELEAADQMVVAALASLTAPAVPDDVAARLTAAFRAEQPLAQRRTQPSATVTPLHRRPRRAWLPAAAAGLVLFSGGAIGLSLLNGGSSSSDDTTTAAGAATDAAQESVGAFPTLASGVDYADAPAVAAVLPDVLAGTGNRPQSSEDSATSSATSSAPEDTGPGPAAEQDDPLARLRTPEGLADCLAALLPPDEPDVQPEAVDYASYAGEPALAVVLPDPDPTKVSIFVVGAGCTQAADGTLFFTRLDRP